MKKFLLILLFIYILWRDDFQKFFRTLNSSEGDLLSFLIKEITGSSPSELNKQADLPSHDLEDEDDFLGNEESEEPRPELQTYSRKEVMQLLHISETTLWRYQQKNILSAHPVGPNHVVFIKSEVDALISKKKGGVTI